MTHLSMSRSGQRTIVRAVPDDRLLGYIFESGQGFHTLAAVPSSGPTVYLVAESYAEAIDVFERLTFLPAGNECFSGFANGAQASWMAYVVGDHAELFVANTTKDTTKDNIPEKFAVDVHMNADELRELHGIVSFALARLAVQS